MLPTLADEIVNALPDLMLSHPHGPSISVISEHLGARPWEVRRALKEINAQGRADLMRRFDSREQFLVPLRHRAAAGYRYCAHCGAEFEMPGRKRSNGCTYYSNRRTCTRACSVALSWTRPGTKAKRGEGIAKAMSTPKAKARTKAHNRRRWSDPEQHRKLSEQNKREWSDPVKAALRAQSIKEVNGSPKMRKFYSDMRRKQWRDPQMRKKMMERSAAGKRTAEYRAKHSVIMQSRWNDPEQRKKLLAATRRNAAKAGSLARGKKQTQEHIDKRFAKRRAKA